MGLERQGGTFFLGGDYTTKGPTYGGMDGFPKGNTADLIKKRKKEKEKKSTNTSSH